MSLILRTSPSGMAETQTAVMQRRLKAALPTCQGYGKLQGFVVKIVILVRQEWSLALLVVFFYANS